MAPPPMALTNVASRVPLISKRPRRETEEPARVVIDTADDEFVVRLHGDRGDGAADRRGVGGVERAGGGEAGEVAGTA